MTIKFEPSELPGWPAAMSQQMAASYCGLSVGTFASVCPVVPISITASKAGQRYLKLRLDEWLLSLDINEPSPNAGIERTSRVRQVRTQARRILRTRGANY